MIYQIFNGGIFIANAMLVGASMRIFIQILNLTMSLIDIAKYKSIWSLLKNEFLCLIVLV